MKFQEIVKKRNEFFSYYKAYIWYMIVFKREEKLVMKINLYIFSKN